MIKHEKGQTLVEYALIILLIALVVIAMLGFAGQTLNNTYYSRINNTIGEVMK